MVISELKKESHQEIINIMFANTWYTG